MSMYKMHCTVCKKSCGTRSKWLEHLIEDEHQERARNDCQQWDDAARQCAVVIFTNFPVKPYSKHVLWSFSTGDRVVTDFVQWINYRPRVAFIQFESKAKVDEIIPDGSFKTEVKINDKIIQVKRATEFMKLEWADFFPDKIRIRTDIFETNITLPSNSRPSPKNTPVAVSIQPIPTPVAFTVISKSTIKSPKNIPVAVSIQPIPPPVAFTVISKSKCTIKSKLKTKTKANRVHPYPTPSSTPNGKVENSSCTIKGAGEQKRLIDIPIPINQVRNYVCLKEQYRALREDIKIGDEYLEVASTIMKDLRATVQTLYPKNKVCMFRHWYLKMKNAGTNELMLMLDVRGVWEPSGWAVQGFPFDQQSATTDYAAKKILDSHLNLSEKFQLFVSSGSDATSLDALASRWTHVPSNFQFSMTMHRFMILETQTCRLVKYLTTFDRRVHPLLNLITYWARNNRISFATRPFVTGGEPFPGAEPTSLEWLVLFFLCKKKVIPTVREITQRQHSELIFHGHDIGFEGNLKCSAWSTTACRLQPGTQEFILSVLILMREFFSYYQDLPQDPFILNMKDAEIMHVSSLWNINENLITRNSLPPLYPQELTSLVKQLPYFKRNRMTLLHPLCFSTSLSFNHELFFSRNQLLMKCTAERMSKYNLDLNVPDINVDLRSFFCNPFERSC